MISTAELIELRDLVREALNTSRKLERAHDSYIKRTTTEGFARSSTTSYNALAGNLTPQLKLEVKAIKALIKKL